MALIDKKLADMTPRDAVNLWTLTGIWDAIQIVLVFPFFFKKSAARRSAAEIERDRKAYDRQLMVENLLK